MLMEKIKTQFNIGKYDNEFYKKFCEILLNSVISLLKIHENSFNQNNNLNQQQNFYKIDKNVFYNLYAIKSILSDNPNGSENYETEGQDNKIDNVIKKIIIIFLSAKNNLKNQNEEEINNDNKVNN